jgi:hypothetical protein
LRQLGTEIRTFDRSSAESHDLVRWAVFRGFAVWDIFTNYAASADLSEMGGREAGDRPAERSIRPANPCGGRWRKT